MSLKLSHPTYREMERAVVELNTDGFTFTVDYNNFVITVKL